MNQFCQHESKVVVAVQTDHWPEALRAHVASCLVCRETAQLARDLQDVAGRADVCMPQEIDPNVLWLKAQLNAPRQKQPVAPWVIPAVAVVIGGLAFAVHQMLSAIPRASDGIPSLAPGVPFPLDGTLIVLILAILLVLWLPSTGSMRLSKKVPGKLVAL